jgi:hypothetical protein
MINGISAAQESPCGGDSPCPVYVRQATILPAEPAQPSWIFSHGTYTHDPYTGARVAQYMPIPPVEPLDDQRMVTSRYRRSRTNLRGIDGSIDTYYEVQQWGNGRGGLDAEWERFHDAWKESYLSGGYLNQSPWSFAAPYGGAGFSYGGPYGGGPGGWFPGYGFPPQGYPPNYGGGPHGHPGGHGKPHSGGPHGKKD